MEENFATIQQHLNATVPYNTGRRSSYNLSSALENQLWTVIYLSA